MVTPANFPKPRLVVRETFEPKPIPSIARQMARGEDAQQLMKRFLAAKVRTEGLPVIRHRETLNPI